MRLLSLSFLLLGAAWAQGTDLQGPPPQRGSQANEGPTVERTVSSPIMRAGRHYVSLPLEPVDPRASSVFGNLAAKLHVWDGDGWVRVKLTDRVRSTLAYRVDVSAGTRIVYRGHPSEISPSVEEDGIDYTGFPVLKPSPVSEWEVAFVDPESSESDADLADLAYLLGGGLAIETTDGRPVGPESSFVPWECYRVTKSGLAPIIFVRTPSNDAPVIEAAVERTVVQPGGTGLPDDPACQTNVRVTVRDAEGMGRPDVGVGLTVIEGDGRIDPQWTTTDEGGNARAIFRSGYSRSNTILARSGSQRGGVSIEVEPITIKVSPQYVFDPKDKSEIRLEAVCKRSDGVTIAGIHVHWSFYSRGEQTEGRTLVWETDSTTNDLGVATAGFRPNSRWYFVEARAAEGVFAWTALVPQGR